MTKKSAKKNKASKKAKKNPVMRNGRKLYGAAAKAVLKQRAAKKRKNAAKKRTATVAAKPNPKPKSAKKRATTTKPKTATKNAATAKPKTQRKKRNSASPSAHKQVLAELKRLQAQAATQKPKRAAKKRTRRNPDATPPGAIFEMFTGQPHSQTFEVAVADGQPRSFDVLGEFEEFVWIDREGQRHRVNLWKQGTRALLGNKRNKDGYDHLLLAAHPETPDQLPRFSLPEGDHGWIAQVTYWAQKVHLGDTKPRPYYHDLGTSPVAGEGTGVLPVFHINHEGALIFKGGQYWIEDRGIVN